MGTSVPLFVTEEDVELRKELDDLKARVRNHDAPEEYDDGQFVSLDKVDVYAEYIVRYARRKFRMSWPGPLQFTLGKVDGHTIFRELEQQLFYELYKKGFRSFAVTVVPGEIDGYDYSTSLPRASHYNAEVSIYPTS